jgi:surface carbohydrate biosynthesis protein
MWGNPVKSSVLIYEKTGSEELKKMILKEISTTVYTPDTIYISKEIFYYFFKNIIFKSWLLLSKEKINFIRLIKNIYLFCIINYIKPKVVVTFVDNSYSFSMLSKYYKKSAFFAIQNGTRTKRRLLNNYIHLSNFFCFGEYERYYYKEMNKHVDNFIPIGSLRGSHFIHSIKKANDIKYDLSMICQMTDANFDNIEMKNRFIAIDSLLSLYVKENKLKIAILRRSNSITEETYYKQLYGDNAIMITYDNSTMSTYRGMYNSEVIITYFSTCGREAFGWGSKVLFIDFSSTELDNYFGEGIWILRENSYSALKKRLDYVRSMPKDIYWSHVKEYAKYLMQYNLEFPTNNIIRDKILEYL